MFSLLRTATILLFVMTLITGAAYPLAVTLVAQAAFPHAANGSLLEKSLPGSNPSAHGNSRDGRSGPSRQKHWVGSELVGQSFSDPKYFWGRPSATAPVPYNGLGGSGSNQSATNPALIEAVKDRVAKLRAADPDNTAAVPVDLVTASGSGLDPHISLAAALYQAGRVARVRKIDPDVVNKLVFSHTEHPTIGVFGQTRVNVLKLNLALDSFTPEGNEAGAE
jgi:K+-transporting ATPase ATPase C chain